MKRVLFTCLILMMASPAQADGLFGKIKNLLGSDTEEAGADSGLTGAAALLTSDEVIQGLKEALRVGTERVTGQLGAKDGFNLDPEIHIPLPENLKLVQDTLRKVGMSSLADDVELKMNRGAELAAPKAKELIWSAIENMTIEDAKKIYDGPKDAATQYFRSQASPELRQTIKPVIDQMLGESGAVAAYDTMISEYKSIPFVPDIKSSLTDHATELALDGIFHYLAQEEAAIRENPAKRTTEILMKVFGQ